MQIQHTQLTTYSPHLQVIPQHDSDTMHHRGYVAVYLDSERNIRLSLSERECRDLAARLNEAAHDLRAAEANTPHTCEHAAVTA